MKKLFSFFLILACGAVLYGFLYHAKEPNFVIPKNALAHYQFTPTHGVIVTGASTTITSATGNNADGVNVGSWKGTLGDDNYHWVVAGAGASGLDVNLTIGGVQLNGANKLIVQTEFDLDATVLATEVQICDWTSTTDVDDPADDECVGGGWRTLNTKNEMQGPQRLVHTAGTSFQWHLYNGYWSTGTTGGSAVNTPLTNFVNGSDQMKFRYFSASSSVAEIAIDHLRVYPLVDPVYHAGGFVQDSGGTPVGHYGNTFSVGNTVNAQQGVTTGDGIPLSVPGTAGTTSNFYLTFKNVKTYTGMNTILVNAETLCSAATSDLRYRYKIRNFNNNTWEDISQPLDCSATGVFDNFALNNIIIDDYINASNEIWVGVYALSNSTTQIRIDSIYLILGTTNTDTNTCELSFGSNIAGRIATNPSAPGADRIQSLTTDGTYMYLGGYDSVGIDNRWRIEKRNLSDGALVSAFGDGGATSTDPSTGADQIFAIATTSGAIFVAGYDLAVGAGQWRIEKRDSTDGTLETAFDTDGIITTNPSGNLDQINAIATDDSYLYVAGVQDTTSGTWRIHKYDITTGALVTAFDGDGIATNTLAASGDERPQALKVDSDYLYIAGYDNVPGNIEWRLEKRNKTTGALCLSGTECTSGAFGVGGVATSNPTTTADYIYAMAIDDAYIYTGGHDAVISAANTEWRIEKRDIATGALVTAFDTDGIVQNNPGTAIDWITDMVVDDTHLYLGGFAGSTAGTWRVDKRNKTSGATTTAEFPTSNGTILSEDGADDRLNAMALVGDYLYLAGYGTAPGDNQWLIEKHATGTGLRSNDSFGANDCTGTRNIDVTAGSRDAWAIQTQDESTNHSTPYYGLDTDGDGTVEEAGAATVGFSVVVPSNAAVTGIYWAGRAMNGAGAGTVRLAVKDYSGLTGVTGGRSLVGASLGAAMTYTDPLVVGSVLAVGTAGYMTNPEDYVDTVNNAMSLSLVTNSDGATSTNAVNIWDFAMVSFSWVEDANHESGTYQFTPTHGVIVTGASTTITSATANNAEGVNVGSWKGTLGDDNYHWVVAGAGASGLDVNLTIGGVQLNGANKLIVQTEFDLDATVLATEVQICDWTSSTNVSAAADSECTGGGWRTLNTKNEMQGPQRLVHTAGTSFQWHLYNGYWSTGTTGGSAIDTPLTNFVNGSDEMKFRYFSASSSVAEIAIDHLRVYPLVDPVYHAGGFVQDSGGTPVGHYGNTFSVGNTVNAQQGVTTGDGIPLSVPGTAGTTSNFYLTFKNVKTYTGMNTILVNAETLCSAATSDLRYRYKIRNFNNNTWEDISQPLDCSATGVFDNFALNNIIIDDYINASNEIWVGVYALSNSTTQIRIDSIYLILGTTNTDTNTCELSFGSNIAGRIATNPSAPGADRIQSLTTDGTYMYLGGYDSVGIDNRWRIEKRNLSDGALVSAFGDGGATSTDPSTGADQIFAIATTSGAIFVAGYDLAVGAGQWRIEKRDSTDGTLETAFDTDGIITTNPSGNLDQINAIATDDSYLYVAGVQDTTSGTWRIHKYDITTGALVTAFDGDGIATNTLAASGDERPQALKVDSDYLYIAGYDNVPGNIEWRLEKRNKTTGALCLSGTECTSGAFGVGGVATSNPTTTADYIYAMAIDDAYIYTGGHDAVISAANTEWRIEKRDIATGALVTAFDTDGIVQNNPGTAIDWITDMVVDDTHLYLGGFAGSTAGTWRVDKRNKTSGATTTAEFPTSNGTILSEDGADDRLNAMALVGDYLYLAGYGTAPGDNQWLIEKHATGTGLRSNDSFGANDCTGTRNIDVTAGSRDAWAIQTQDESTNHSTPYYGLDTDGDGTVEEAGAATVGFSVVVPSNAAVTGIYWAGRAMNGAGAGTVRLAVKDYSGLTGVTGGRSLVGASLGAAMTYTDPLVVGSVLAVGTAGYMTNPEDYVDTVNNAMSLSLVTNSDGATSTNAVNIWDFAMVSFSWVEVTPAPVFSISITSDGVIEYGSVNLNTASTTVGGDTQTVENTSVVPARINVRSSNAIGGISWLLNTSVASDQYTHEFSTTTGSTWVYMPDSSTYVLASPTVASSGSIPFDFRITTPLGTSDFAEKAINITVQAVAP